MQKQTVLTTNNNRALAAQPVVERNSTKTTSVLADIINDTANDQHAEYINKCQSLKIWGANVCSITGKCDTTLLRRLKLENMIKKQLPDIVILLETNLSQSWNPDESTYDCCRTIDASDGGCYILVKRKYNCKMLDAWSKYALAVELNVYKLRIIALYTPYPYLSEDVIEFRKKWAKGQWITFADHEKKIHEFAEVATNQYIPKWTRESQGKYYCTDGFYSSTEIKGYLGEKISDHYLLIIQTPNYKQVVQKHIQAITKKRIEFWASRKSIMRKEIIKAWPDNSMIDIAKRYIKPKIIKKKIWIIDDIEKWNINDLKKWKIQMWKNLMSMIDSAVMEGNLLKLAMKLRKALHITDVHPRMNGFKMEDGSIVKGSDASEAVDKYFSSLYKSDNNVVDEKYWCKKSSIDFEDTLYYINKKLARGKAMSLDSFPDSLVDDYDILQKLTKFVCEVACGKKIPEIYKTGRLLLLNKVKDEFPKISETRPITILSAVYKAIELAWARKYKTLIWKNIGFWQHGFRDGYGTQILIYKLKQWMHQNSKQGIIIFVDVKKAFDNADRSQIIQKLAEIGIDEQGIQWYKNLLSNMKLQYNGKIIKYQKGVPQGSTLGPMMFALIYETVLKEAIVNGWEVWAYADDLALGLKTQTDYLNAVKWLKTWPEKIKMCINDAKTKEIRMGKAKQWKGQFEEVKKYKYLGVWVYQTRIKASVIKHLKENIEYARIKSERIKAINKSAARISCIWWTMSKLIYATATDVALGWIEASKVESLCIKALRKSFGTLRSVSNNLLTEYLQMNIRNTLLRLSDKIQQKAGVKLPIRKKSENDTAKEWLVLLKASEIEISMIAKIKSKRLYTKQGYYVCKDCLVPASVEHLSQHNNLSSQEYYCVKALQREGITGFTKSLLHISSLKERVKLIESLKSKIKYIKDKLPVIKPIFKIIRSK